MESFGLSLPDRSLLNVQGQELLRRNVQYANDQEPIPGKKFQTIWNINNVKLKKTVPINRWTYAMFRSFNTRADARKTARIANEFHGRLKHHGMLASPYLKAKSNNHHVLFDNQVSGPFMQWLDQFRGTKADGSKFLNLQFLLIILPDEDKERYNKLKEFCDKVGIDVTHSDPESALGSPSVASMVACTDGTLAQWPAELRIQQGRSRKRGGGLEMTTLNLKDMLQAHLMRWAITHNGNRPNNIIIFRDGIGNGQYQASLEGELPQLRAACNYITPAGQAPRLTFIVCAKRHQTRLVKPDKKNPKKVSNPSGGTYVDRSITDPRLWDFYLQTHEAIHGTAKPAHYIVRHDDIIRQEARERQPPVNPANLLAGIIHAMCYLFQRSTGAVSICPAVYYADLACTRARCYLRDVYNGTKSAPRGTMDSDAALADWHKSLQSLLDVHPRLKDCMNYV
ncbi:MAG: hypothetical protein Q9208_005581 [Pyrenodesmia sp. 3 TL-2023]